MIFSVYMYQFAAGHQTSTLKLPAFFWRFETEEHIPRVNKSKITGENPFNADHFEIGGNHEPSKDKETLFLDILQICGQSFNP